MCGHRIPDTASQTTAGLAQRALRLHESGALYREPRNQVLPPCRNGGIDLPCASEPDDDRFRLVAAQHEGYVRWRCRQSTTEWLIGRAIDQSRVVVAHERDEGRSFRKRATHVVETGLHVPGVGSECGAPFREDTFGGFLLGARVRALVMEH
jgi:hypothetical protein